MSELSSKRVTCICGKTFRDKVDLKRHENKKYSCLITVIKITDYQCKKCNKYFSNSSNVNKHSKKCNVNTQTDSIIASQTPKDYNNLIDNLSNTQKDYNNRSAAQEDYKTLLPTQEDYNNRSATQEDLVVNNQPTHKDCETLLPTTHEDCEEVFNKLYEKEFYLSDLIVSTKWYHNIIVKKV